MRHIILEIAIRGKDEPLLRLGYTGDMVLDSSDDWETRPNIGVTVDQRVVGSSVVLRHRLAGVVLLELEFSHLRGDVEQVRTRDLTLETQSDEVNRVSAGDRCEE